MRTTIFLFAIAVLFFSSCKSEEKKFEQQLEDIAQYLQDNNIDAEMTASGLHYAVLSNGTGTTSPGPFDQVRVDYRGEFFDGVIFDQNTNAVFGVNQVIAGWTEGLQLMNVGDRYLFVIPSRLAYGERGTGSIPGDTPLVFDVTLKAF